MNWHTSVRWDHKSSLQLSKNNLIDPLILMLLLYFVGLFRLLLLTSLGVPHPSDQISLYFHAVADGTGVSKTNWMLSTFTRRWWWFECQTHRVKSMCRYNSQHGSAWMREAKPTTPSKLRSLCWTGGVCSFSFSIGLCPMCITATQSFCMWNCLWHFWFYKTTKLILSFHGFSASQLSE